MDDGTPLYSLLSGKIVWAGMNGPLGGLAVIANRDYQVCLERFSEIYVEEGMIVERGSVLGLSSGDLIDPGSGNSSSSHRNYGVKKREGENYW